MRYYPPRDKPLVIGIVKLCMPFLRRHYFGGVTIRPTPRALELLRAQEGPAILAPNHPTQDDPAVMFDLSRQVGRNYSFVAAYEVFEAFGRFRTWLFQSCGAYSVVRGTVDRESFRTTRRLLAEEHRTVVIFIEGTAPYQNDSLLPFQPGVAQLGFWSLEDAAKRDALPDALPIVPLCIKYVFRDDPMAGLDSLLSGLEREVIGKGSPGESMLERIRVLGEGVLGTLEDNLGVTPPKDAELGERVENLKEELLQRAESFAAVQVRPSASFTDRVFATRRAADSALLGAIEGESPYQQRLFAERHRRLAFLDRDIERLTMFSNFYDSYLQEYPSPERIADVLDRLHREVHSGKRAPLPHRIAVVDSGEPIDLVQRLDEYRAARKATVLSITDELRSRSLTLLEDLYRSRTKPVSERG